MVTKNVRPQMVTRKNNEKGSKKMKKLFFYLLTIIILCVGVIGFNLYKHSKIESYHNSLKVCVGKEPFYLTDITDFEWDRAVAFEFPADLKDFEEASGIKINFEYDVSGGIIFINNGKIVFKDISDINPESPSPIIYELNDKHLSVYEKDTLVYVEKYEDEFYFIKKAE